LLNPLEQSLLEFEQAGKVWINVGRLVDVLENGAQAIVKEDGGNGSHCNLSLLLA